MERSLAALRDERLNSDICQIEFSFSSQVQAGKFTIFSIFIKK